MKSYMMAVGEFRDSRFEKLFEILAGNDAAVSKAAVVGHLSLWRARWAGDESFDHGIFWDIDLTRMGMWAEFGSPKVFGLALKGAGYIKQVADVWPAELVDKRQGYVAMLADGGIELDASWTGWHRKCQRKAELFVYLTDKQRRVDAMHANGWAFPYSKERLPEGWLDGVPSAEARAGRIGAGFSGEGSAGVTSGQVGSTAGGVTPAHGGRPQGGMSPPQGGLDGGQGGTGLRPPASPALRQEDVNNQLTKRRIPNRTGYEPTAEMRDFIRKNKYDQTMRCLVEMDDGQETMAVWRWAVAERLQTVQSLLDEMTKTDEAWSKISNPCSVVFKSVFSGYMEWKRRNREEAGGRGRQGGGLRVLGGQQNVA